MIAKLSLLINDKALVAGDVDEEMNVSEVSFLVSGASKLSVGARSLKGPCGPEILVLTYLHTCILPYLHIAEILRHLNQT